MKKDIFNINDTAFVEIYCIEQSEQKKRNKDNWHPHVTPAVLIVPGGGYVRIEECEKDPVAFSFLNKGFSVFILNYTCGEKSAYPQPVIELYEAIRLIRENSERYNVDKEKIAVCGFSAGGHLAALGMAQAELFKDKYNYNEIKANALILGYPIIDVSLFCKLRGDRIYGFGNMLHIKDKDDISRDVTPYVNETFPPCFNWHTNEDDLVDNVQSMELVKKLVENKSMVEYHLFSRGHHGLSTCSTLTNYQGNMTSGKQPVNVAMWVEMAEEWLKDLFEY